MSLFELLYSLLFRTLAPVVTLHGFTQYDEDGYPMDDDYEDDEEDYYDEEDYEDDEEDDDEESGWE